MAKVTITEEGMIRTGEYVNKLRKAQQDGIVDNIPTATDILAELIKNAKTTTEGIFSVYGITFIKGQDYELYEIKSNKNIVNKLQQKEEIVKRPQFPLFVCVEISIYVG